MAVGSATQVADEAAVVLTAAVTATTEVMVAVVVAAAEAGKGRRLCPTRAVVAAEVETELGLHQR